jgi:hypothetical protein
LVERLREGIKMLEVSHPTATGVMDRTINMLARMGIWGIFGFIVAALAERGAVDSMAGPNGAVYRKANSA